MSVCFRTLALKNAARVPVSSDELRSIAERVTERFRFEQGEPMLFVFHVCLRFPPHRHVDTSRSHSSQEALHFSRFRFKLIEFLRLSSDIREPALREALERTCCGVYKNYLARANRVEEILKSEGIVKMSASSVSRQPARQHCRLPAAGRGMKSERPAG
jgi:hypothetical protein